MNGMERMRKCKRWSKSLVKDLEKCSNENINCGRCEILKECVERFDEICGKGGYIPTGIKYLGMSRRF